MNLSQRVGRLETAAQTEKSRRNEERLALIYRALASREDPALSPEERARVNRIVELLDLARQRREGAQA